MPELASSPQACCSFRPPPELWVLIFEQAKLNLHSITLTSKTFHALANPLLYRSISLEKNAPIFRLFATLLDRRPRLAEHVVELHLTFKQNKLEGDVFLKSFRRIRRVLELEQLRNLKLLNLDMDLVEMESHIMLPAFRWEDPPPPSEANIQADYPDLKEPIFQLEVFATDLFCDGHMAQFLKSQTNVQRLTLGGGFDTDFENFIYTHSKDASKFLPRLAFVDCDALLAAPLIEGRPVTSVQLPLMDSNSTVLSSLQASNAPEGVNQLILLLPRSTSPPSLLERVAEGAPRLVQLSIYFGMGYTFDEESLLALAPSLSLLKSLKVLVMPAVHVELQDANVERTIITHWAQSMPCLRAVLMPSKRFFVCTKACKECCERLRAFEVAVGYVRGARLCLHDDRELLGFWMAHDSVDD